MTIVLALTGTPGTGKTSTVEVLRPRGYSVIYLNALAEASGARTVYDDERDTWEVDLDTIRTVLDGSGHDGDVILEGHWAHELDCDLIVCLRCEPAVLGERLSERGYSETKVGENVWAEALSVIAAEAAEKGVRTEQIDTTNITPDEVADAVERAIAGESFPPVQWDDWLMENT